MKLIMKGITKETRRKRRGKKKKLRQ